MTQSTSKTEDTSKNQSCSGGCFKWGCAFPTLSILVLVLFSKIVFGVLSFYLDVPVHTLVSCATHGIDVRKVTPIKKKTVMLPGNVPLEMVWVPAGTYTTSDYKQALKKRYSHSKTPPLKSYQITISHGFWMGRYEFTQKQWAAVMNEKAQHAYCPDCPKEWVSWHRVQNCLDALNEITGESFRLPTSAEWEHAYRAGTSTRFYWGDDWDQHTWFLWDDYIFSNESSCRGKEHPVGKKLPNSWGLYDMAGNASEWCQDTYYSQKDLDEAVAIDPVGAEMEIRRAIRSIGRGCWEGGSSAEANYVGATFPDDSHHGFRLVLAELNQSAGWKDTAQ